MAHCVQICEAALKSDCPQEPSGHQGIKTGGAALSQKSIPPPPTGAEFASHHKPTRTSFPSLECMPPPPIPRALFSLNTDFTTRARARTWIEIAPPSAAWQPSNSESRTLTVAHCPLANIAPPYKSVLHCRKVKDLVYNATEFKVLASAVTSTAPPEPGDVHHTKLLDSMCTSVSTTSRDPVQMKGVAQITPPPLADEQFVK